MNYNLKRDEYRAYLHTPVWLEIRSRALAHYGCICKRCGEHGTDVHHKTYERVGGDELLSDLEVLCRDCHDAHHQLDKFNKTPKKRKRSRRGMHVTGAYNYLTPRQRAIIEERFGKSASYEKIQDNKIGHKVREQMMELLGLDYLYGMKKPDEINYMQFHNCVHEKGKRLKLSVVRFNPRKR
jgi:hypothetical protein